MSNKAAIQDKTEGLDLNNPLAMEDMIAGLVEVVDEYAGLDDEVNAHLTGLLMCYYSASRGTTEQKLSAGREAKGIIQKFRQWKDMMGLL